MRKIGSLNDFSEKYVQKFQLKDKQVVEYKLLNGKPNDDPDTNKKRPMNYPRTVFSLKGQEGGIWDPEKKRNIVCGIPRDYQMTSGGEIMNPVWEKFVVDSPDGVFALVGGQGIANEIYFMLEHHPENASTDDHPDFAKKFKKIDRVSDAKVKTAQTKTLREALNFIDQMNESEIREFAAGSGWAYKEELEVLSSMIQELAIADPAKFLARVNDRKTSLLSLVRKAKAENVIGYSNAQNKFTWVGSDDVLAQFEKADGVDPDELLADYLLTGGNEAAAKVSQMKKALGMDPKK